MIDVARFQTQLENWRGYWAEGYALGVAQTLGTYILTHLNDFTHIKESLVPESDIVRAVHAFNQTNGRASLYGSLAFLLFIIDQHIEENDDQLVDGEHEVLTSLVQKLKDLYVWPLVSSQEKCTEIETLTLEWLNDYANAPTKQALCIAFYVAFKMVSLHSLYAKVPVLHQTILNNICEQASAIIERPTPLVLRQPREEENSEDGSEVDDEEFRFLNEEEDSDEEVYLTPTSSSPALPVNLSPVDLKQYFEQQTLDQLLTPTLSLQEKITQLTASLQTTHDLLQTLVRVKRSLTVLDNQLVAARALSSAVIRDGNQEFHATALDLIQRNQSHFDALKNILAEEEKIEWDNRIEALRPHATWPIPQKKLQDTTTFITDKFRQWTPSYFQSSADNLPPTPDEECKTALLALAQDRFDALSNDDGEISEKTRELNTTILALAGTNPGAALSLENTTTVELEQLLDENRVIHTAITAWQPLIETISSNQEQLHRCRILNKKMEDFITAHDGFWVALSLFVSYYLGSFFKTNTAEKIEKVRETKKTVTIWEQLYDTTFQNGIRQINVQESPAAIKNNFLDQLIRPQEPPQVAEEFPTTMLTKYTDIHTLFGQIRPIGNEDHAEPLPRTMVV